MIHNYRNVHLGERVFIVATGPSTMDLPFDKLENEYTISLNNIGLIYEFTSWRPSYYVSFNAAIQPDGNYPKREVDLIQKNIDHGVQSFCSEKTKQYLKRDNEVVYYEGHFDKSGTLRDAAVQNRDITSIWTKNLESGIFNFGGTISVAAQLAVYMGFDQIYFLGCDLFRPHKIPYTLFEEADHPTDFDFRPFKNTFQKLGFYSNESSSPKRSLINLIWYHVVYLGYLRLLNKFYPGFPSRDHILPGYREHATRIPERRNESTKKTHQVILLASDKYDFEVFNATPAGYLDVYERVDLSDLF